MWCRMCSLIANIIVYLIFISSWEDSLYHKCCCGHKDHHRFCNFYLHVCLLPVICFAWVSPHHHLNFCIYKARIVKICKLHVIVSWYHIFCMRPDLSISIVPELASKQISLSRPSFVLQYFALWSSYCWENLHLVVIWQKRVPGWSLSHQSCSFSKLLFPQTYK